MYVYLYIYIIVTNARANYYKTIDSVHSRYSYYSAFINSIQSI